MTWTRLHVNRTSELNRIRTALAQPASGQGCLLGVESRLKMGKTALLWALERNPPSGTHVVRVDLDQVSDDNVLSPTDILGEIATQLDIAGVDVARYLHCRDEQLNVHIHDIELNYSSLVVGEAKEESVANKLLEELTKDLTAARAPMLVLVDTFEAAGAQSHHWLLGQAIPRLLSVSGLVLVVAGRDLRKLADRHARADLLRLRPLHQTNIVEWLKGLSAPYTAEALEDVAHVLCLLGRGVPARIETYLLGLTQNGWRMP